MFDNRSIVISAGLPGSQKGKWGLKNRQRGRGKEGRGKGKEEEEKEEDEVKAVSIEGWSKGG